METLGLHHNAHQRAGALSHGQMQWLEIGMVIVQEPVLFLLDEPVAGMTRDEREKTAELLQWLAKDHAVLVVEHDMEFVRQTAHRVTKRGATHALEDRFIVAIEADGHA